MTTVAPAIASASSSLNTSGVSSFGEGGLFGGLSGGQGLLGGLFAQLFGGTLGKAEGESLPIAQGSFVGEGLFNLEGEALEGSSGVLSQLQNLMSRMGAVDASALPKLGTEVTQVTAAVVTIQKTVTVFKSHSLNLEDIDSTENLAAAFETLGVDPETATDMAARIDEALTMVRAKLASVLDALDISTDTMNFGQSLVAISTVQVELLQVTQVVATQVTALQTREVAFAKGQATAPIQDVAKLVVNEKPLVSAQTGQALPVNTEAAEKMHAQLADLLPEQKAAPKVEAPITQAVQAVERTAVAPQSMPSEVAAPMAQNQRVAHGRDARRYESAIEAGTELKAPSGTAVYKWQVSVTGHDILQQLANPEQLAPVADALPEDMAVDDMMADLKQSAQIGKVDETARSDNRLPFAERLMQAAKAQVTQQVTVQMTKAAEQGGGSVRIQLNPEELGSVDIELQVANGRVHGVISAERPEVLEQMARDLQMLKQSLADAGFTLGEEGMSLLLKDGSESNDTHFAENNGDESTGEISDATDGAGHAPQRWVAPDRILDVNV